MYISREGQATPWQLGVYSDVLTSGLAEIVRTVHSMGSKVIMQLAHAGLRATSNLSGLEPLGPSHIERRSGPIGREMTRDDIETVAHAFPWTAIRAQAAGFDGVQIHGVHGYLLNQFLSPFFNKREDEYGGITRTRQDLFWKL